MRASLLLFISIYLLGCNISSTTKGREKEMHSIKISSLKDLSEKAIKDLKKIKFDSTQIPRTMVKGRVKGTTSKSWTSGFYPGLLWQLYSYSKNEILKDAAIKWSKVIEKEKNDRGTHDLGFKIYCPFGNAYKITNEKKYSDIFLKAAKTLSTRFNPKVKAIRSWDYNRHLWRYPVIIDNMMNLEILFEASRLTGDSTFYDIANKHANTTLKHHFRKDNSSYHVVDFNPQTGEVIRKNTHQGLNHESAWSRGQAWGLYGFTIAYRYTNEQKYLEQAQKIATYIFNHPNLPSDLIPYWDYNTPNIPNEPRDASAAAITASALLELSCYTPKEAKQYQNWADKILRSLSSKEYQCDTAPFFLKHSVGSLPGKSEIDVPIIYADYYFIEALIRRDKMLTKER